MRSPPPLITLALFAYNQEQYVECAIAGAFDQDYPNLEIVISDDSSADRTYALIKAMVATYRGPHKIILNRNEANLGITSHVNKVFSISCGELFVVAACDDISRADRVSKLASTWAKHDYAQGMLHSVAQPIDTNGLPIHRAMRGLLSDRDTMSLEFFRANRSKMLVHGATAAYTRNLIEEFGPLRPGGAVEDAVLTFRAGLSGKIMFVDEPLVQYRISESSVTGVHHSIKRPDRWLWWMSAQESKLLNHLSDYESFQIKHGRPVDSEFAHYLAGTAKGFAQARCMTSTSWLKRAWGLLRLPGLPTFRDKLSFAYRFYK